jgi:hypothetical protein
MIWLKLLDSHVMPPSQHKSSTEKFPLPQGGAKWILRLFMST